jgi:hypothetical protein
MRGESARLTTLVSLVLACLLMLVVQTAKAQVQMPQPGNAETIAISAQAGNHWQVGDYDVWLLRGNCSIQQGQTAAKCDEAVLWIDRAEPTEQKPNKVIAYLEGNVEINSRAGNARITDRTWFGRYFSNAPVQVQAATTAGKPDTLPPVYWRGMERRSPEPNETNKPSSVTQTQFLTPVAGTASTPAPAASRSPFPESRPNALPTMVPQKEQTGPAVMLGGGRRIRIFPRSDTPVQANWSTDPATNQMIGVIDSGVNVVVDGLGSVSGMGEVGTIDVSTDRLVIWTQGAQEPDLTGKTPQDERVPLEFYMEGNIVFRQGERVIQANRMYYDFPNHVGTVLDAEMLTPVRNYKGLLRLRSEVLQQTAQDRFFAKNSFLTSSRMGEPTYRLEAGDMYFEDIQHPQIDSVTGQPLVDPVTNEPIVHHERNAVSSNNLIYLGSVPVFYWPTMATDMEDPAFYIRRAAFGNNRVFGTEVLTHWNGYQLLGIRQKPAGTDLDVSLDYMSKRGFGYGATFTYDRPSIFGLDARGTGFTDFWGIQDNGIDDLGEYRRNVPLEESYRYRLYGQHRQLFGNGFQLSEEFGLISDRNFVEEYHKSEWEQLKDETTGIELKRVTGNNSWSLSADYRVNDFFTQTDWLPRLDHYWMGASVFDTFTWYEHSSAAYAKFEPTTVPKNVSVGSTVGAAGPFNYLPWEPNTFEGERFATRQEFDWPFQLGPVKMVPFVSGEAAHWGQDINGESLDRLVGQVGMRSTLPLWSVDPTVSSDLFNVHGLAHKITFEFDCIFADSNRDVTSLPLYDAIDDDSVEAWRRRFLTTTFGIPSMSPKRVGTPWLTKFDERLYAIRTGLQGNVSSSSTEVMDDLSMIRLGAKQRWQTKRGPANNPHIIDWITLDTDISLYPDPTRDNDGCVAGLANYDFRWHVGDRVTLVSDAMFDFFDQGQKIVSVGGFLTRPPRGSLYMGFYVIEGPTNLNSQVLTLSYSYWMSPKWISSLGTSIDFGKAGNIGQNFSITRVGEAFLVTAGLNVDESRNSVGAVFMVEPRFGPKTRVGNMIGTQIPPSGAEGIE